MKWLSKAAQFPSKAASKKRKPVRVGTIMVASIGPTNGRKFSQRPKARMKRMPHRNSGIDWVKTRDGLADTLDRRAAPGEGRKAEKEPGEDAEGQAEQDEFDRRWQSARD